MKVVVDGVREPVLSIRVIPYVVTVVKSTLMKTWTGGLDGKNTNS
jgi:hypothetical protein